VIVISVGRRQHYLDIMVLAQAIAFGLLNGGVYALAASGLALVFGALNIANFAHGDFIMLGMYATFVVSSLLSVDPVVSILFTVPIFFILGVMVYLGTLHRIMKAPVLSQVAVTIAVLVLLRNVALTVWGGQPKAVSYTMFSGLVDVGGVSLPLSRLASAILSIIALVALELFLKKTRFGIAIRACADDQEATSLMGVNTKWLYSTTFGLGIALTAVAAALIMTFQEVNPLSGVLYGLLAWVIIALSGTSEVKGVLAAATILAIAESLGMFFWDPRGRDLIVYGIFVLILMVRPTGLFGGKS